MSLIQFKSAYITIYITYVINAAPPNLYATQVKGNTKHPIIVTTRKLLNLPPELIS